MHKVLVNNLGGLSLPTKSVVRLTDHPDMTLAVYHGRKTNSTTTYCKSFSVLSLQAVAKCIRYVNNRATLS